MQTLSADLIFATAGAFLLLFSAFVPLERLFPARPGQRVFRPDWRSDCAYFLGQYLVWSSLAVLALSAIALLCRWTVPAEFRAIVASQTWWLQAVEVIILCDLSVYWAHRLSHRVEFLWRFHSIHHTARHLDWLAAHREHPVDGIYTQMAVNLPAFILGFPLETIAGFIAFRGLWAIFIHSNVRVKLGPLRYFLGAPEFHHWHHELSRNSACNFANLMPILDVIFGTFYGPKDRYPEEFGIREYTPPGYFHQILHPFRKRTHAGNRRGVGGG